MTLREILIFKESPLSRDFLHVTDVVDRLHQFPNIPPFPPVLTKSRREDGAYNYTSRPAQSLNITVSILAAHPALTLLHETGHLLDHLALNPIKQGFGSTFDPMFKPLWDLGEKSTLMRIYRKMALQTPKTYPRTRRYLRYQMLPSELWAQTYMQWVVTRSNDHLLVSLLHSVRASPWVYAKLSCGFCWDDDECEAIMGAVDQLFEQAGLR